MLNDQPDGTFIHMDNTAALADVISSLLEKPEAHPKVLTAHGLAVEAGIPWVTLRRRLIKPDALRVEELGRIATVLGKKPSELLALAEELEAHAAA